jgi:CYTH domain-containing protein
MYLDEAEATSIAVLSGDELRKLRRTREVEGHNWSVDEFRRPLRWLILAEIDFGEEGQMPAALPFAVRAEVTSTTTSAEASSLECSPRG